MRTPFRCDRARRALLAAGAALAFLLTPVSARAQMPDLRQMSGAPLPADDLPTGTISVRLVRGDLTNSVAGHRIELHGAVNMTATTDESGRATFTNVPPGGTVHAHTDLDGQSLESQNFAVPGTGGVKVMLVGGAGSATAAPAAPAEPAKPGTVIIGGQSRLGVEPTEDGLDVYLLFDIANTDTAPVATDPVVFTVPDNAEMLTVLEGSSPQAKVDGRRFVVAGPFAPGLTSVQLAYRLPVSSDRMAFAQPLPLDMVTPTVLVRKLGDLRFRSPQAGAARDVAMQDGAPYVLATGQRLAAGSLLEVDVEGLPHHSRLPRYLALGLAVFIVGFGIWLAANGPDASQTVTREQLERKRAELLDRLVPIERQLRAGTGDRVRLELRREELVAQLERVYAQLDRDPGAASAASPATPEPSAVAAGAHAVR